MNEEYDRWFLGFSQRVTYAFFHLSASLPGAAGVDGNEITILNTYKLEE